MGNITFKQKKPKRHSIADKIFKVGATAAGVFVLVMIVLLVFQLISESYPIWEEEGLGFIVGTDWNAVEGRESFGRPAIHPGNAGYSIACHGNRRPAEYWHCNVHL